MSYLLCLAMAPALTMAGPQMDAAEFVATMNALHSDVKSVSLVFEGESQSIDSAGRPRADRPKVRFQGNYAVRVGVPLAGMLDIYRSVGDSPPVRSSYSLLRSVFEESGRPDAVRSLDPRTGQPRLASGAPGSLQVNNSPERYLTCWYFANYSRIDPERMRFECFGTELVEGQPCLKVKLSPMPGGDSSITYLLMWVDLTRGGYPLKIESYFKDRQISRVNHVVLERLSDVKGKLVWLPVKGVIDVFGRIGGEIKDVPMGARPVRLSSARFESTRTCPTRRSWSTPGPAPGPLARSSWSDPTLVPATTGRRLRNGRGPTRPASRNAWPDIWPRPTGRRGRSRHRRRPARRGGGPAPLSSPSVSSA